MDKELVSVIITTYNRDFSILKKAIISVLNQTYTNIELIVVDDNNNDRREELKIETQINEFNCIKYIKHIKNKGLSAARNTGIENALGEYIAFLDDDDEWSKKKIELQVKEIKKDKNIGLVNASYKVIYNNKNGKEVHVPHIRGEGMNYLIENGNYFVYPLIRKKCFDYVGLFDVNLKHSEDFEMWLRILKFYKTSYVDKILSYYYVRKENMTYNYKDFIDASIIIFNKHRNLYSNNNKATWNILNSRSKAYAHVGNVKLAFSSYINAIKVMKSKVFVNIKNLIYIIIIILQTNCNKIINHIK